MRRALCVGVDKYPFGSLVGCVSDADRLGTLLTKHADGAPNFDCRKILAGAADGIDVVTVSTLRKAVHELFRQPAEVALFHFSGHGTVSDLDGYLVTQDATSYHEGVSMSEVLKLANDSQSNEAVVLLDCCYSGNLGNPPVINNMRALLREGVSLLTASRAAQPSVEVNGGGVFTSLVIDALDGGAADILGNVTAPSMYAFVEGALGAWDQRPLFKCHVSRVTDLRRCQPPIERSVLRELPGLFPLPVEDLPLSPAYEASCEERDDRKVAVFSKLQALNRVHLVVPVGVPHMYDAAMQRRGCRLTAAGRYYWRLARNGRI